LLKIICREDCGNAPKKALLKEFRIALARGDLRTALSFVAEDVVCDVIGHRRTQGKDDFAAYAEALKSDPAKELVIDNIITHGPTGALNGRLTTAGGAVRAFCDIYVFNGASAKAKIKEIAAYDIGLEKPKKRRP
jgi:hypothetical protein